MTIAWMTGLVMGAVGSLHCIGMCGPLALSLPVSNVNASTRFISSLLYNIGRVLTYALIGVFTGLLGKGFAMSGFQQRFSIFMGLVIILFVLIPRMGRYVSNGRAVSSFFENLRAKIGSLYFKKNYRSVFAIGMLNGLLPCGMVYMALAVSATLASPRDGSLFMAGFGMGTLPVMWSVAFFGGFISLHVRSRIRKAYPYLMVLMACLLIMRGMGWGIPYLSPAWETGLDQSVNAVDCHQ